MDWTLQRTVLQVELKDIEGNRLWLYLWNRRRRSIGGLLWVVAVVAALVAVGVAAAAVAVAVAAAVFGPRMPC